MKIVSKSVHHSNIVFVFDGSRFVVPENHEFTSFYRGEEAAGARFIDDPVLRTKVLDLPKKKIQITVEPQRLKVDDNSQEDPERSVLIAEAEKVYRQFFLSCKLIGYGFNYDIYYQTDGVIRTSDLLEKFVGKEALWKSDLLDIGVQFTLAKDDGKRETYFVKITSPMEVAIHVNYHFPARTSSLGAADMAAIEKMFGERCIATDELMKELKF